MKETTRMAQKLFRQPHALATLLAFLAMANPLKYSSTAMSNDDAPAPQIEVNNDFEQQGRFWLERMMQPDELRRVCSLKRQPKLTRDPELYFYTFRTKENPTRISLDLTLEMHDGIEPDFGLKVLQEKDIKRKLLDSKLYNKNLVSYFIIHGYLGSHQDPWMHTLKDRILDSGAANIFLVDWSGGSRPEFIFDYGLSVINAIEVTRYLTAFIKNLASSTETDNLDDFHFIGYSLGAQIVGLMGYQLDGAVGRITALDPAGPCFQRVTDQMSSLDARLIGFTESSDGTKPKRRLSASSAKFVLAFHSDIQLLGLNENVAHYDVYMNGGAKQVDCPDSKLGCNHEAILRVILPPAPIVTSISQIELAGKEEESSNKCYPMAYQCNSWQAYQAGECAYCNNDDARCIFTGLSLERYPKIRTHLNLWQGPGLNQSDEQKSIPNSDLVFNNEIDPSAPSQLIDDPLDIRDSARHFTKVGNTTSFCLYQYQVLIATDSIDNRALAYSTTFYLEIPLKPQNRSRLVQVSHLILNGHQAKSDIEESLIHKIGYPLTNKLLDYYTALITFNSTDRCLDIHYDNMLCEPLNDISTTQLYSPTSEALQHVQYVVLNYLSGLNKSIRDAKSLILQPKSNDEVSETSQESKDRLKQIVSSQQMNCLADDSDAPNCDLFDYHIDIENTNKTMNK